MLADSVDWSWLSKASHSDSSSVTFDTIRFCSASGRAIAAVSGKALAAGGSCPFHPRLAPCGARFLREQVRDGGGEELGAGGLGGLELALQGVAQRGRARLPPSRFDDGKTKSVTRRRGDAKRN